MPITYPPTNAMYIAFEEDVLPGVLFRVEGEGGAEVEAEAWRGVVAEGVEWSRSRMGVREDVAAGVGEPGLETVLEFEFEASSPIPAYSPSHSSSEEKVEPNPTTDPRPITLQTLTTFIHQTIHAPFPHSDLENLREANPSHPALRHLDHFLPHPSHPLHSEPLPGSASTPSQHLRSRSDPQTRLLDILGPRTKFGGLGVFRSPSLPSLPFLSSHGITAAASATSTATAAEITETYKGKQVWVVKLVSN